VSGAHVAPIPRATFATIVAEKLRTSIIDGSLEPGSQLAEVELANSFGVSRGPVREALQRLIQEGLLYSEPHRGVFVPVLSDQDVADIYLARHALESAAVRHIIGRSKAAEAYDGLRTHVRAMEEAAAAGDWEAVGNHDLEFHTTLVTASGSARLQRMFSTVIGETRLCLGVLAVGPTRVDLGREHRRISELVRDGDTDGALAALQEHFDGAVVAIRDRRRGADGKQPPAGR
jgi:DNA-binding GntR family transcriptional regulator